MNNHMGSGGGGGSEGLGSGSFVISCNHHFEGRYDFAKVGNVVQRRYVRDICVNCGETIERPFTIREQLEMGIISLDEARQAVK